MKLEQYDEMRIFKTVPIAIGMGIVFEFASFYLEV